MSSPAHNSLLLLLLPLLLLSCASSIRKFTRDFLRDTKKFSACVAAEMTYQTYIIDASHICCSTLFAEQKEYGQGCAMSGNASCRGSALSLRAAQQWFTEKVG
jgi:hypothetical protein